MIAPAYAQMMARYNHWQNDSLIAVATTLSDDQRWADRGAFFGSIGATFRHIYWADYLWLGRFGVVEPPKVASFDEAQQYIPWDAFVAQRGELDAVIRDWADGLTQETIDSHLQYSTLSYGERSGPMAPLIVHLFNHATHHRGQIHAMLTALGLETGPTDLPVLPRDDKEYGT